MATGNRWVRMLLVVLIAASPLEPASAASHLAASEGETQWKLLATQGDPFIKSIERERSQLTVNLVGGGVLTYLHRSRVLTLPAEAGGRPAPARARVPRRQVEVWGTERIPRVGQGPFIPGADGKPFAWSFFFVQMNNLGALQDHRTVQVIRGGPDPQQSVVSAPSRELLLQPGIQPDGSHWSGAQWVLKHNRLDGAPHHVANRLQGTSTFDFDTPKVFLRPDKVQFVFKNRPKEATKGSVIYRELGQFVRRINFITYVQVRNRRTRAFDRLITIDWGVVLSFTGHLPLKDTWTVATTLVADVLPAGSRSAQFTDANARPAYTQLGFDDEVMSQIWISGDDWDIADLK